MPGKAVITGSGIVSSLGDAPATVHRALCEGRRGIRASTDDAALAGVGAAAAVAYDLQPHFGARNVRPLDRTARLATAAAGLALSDSGLATPSFPRDDVGLVLGTMFGSVRTIADFDRRAITAGPQYVSPLDFANTVINAAAGQVAIWYGLRGLNSTIAGGHAGAYAIAHAADLVELGAARALVAGGAEELSAAAAAAFSRAGVLCHTKGDAAPRPVPFGAQRDGFVLGEGAAFVVVEDADSAAQRGAQVRALILGHATVCSGAAGRRTAGGEEVARAISMALDAANVSSEDLDCISASASGSIDGDAAEACGLLDALGARAATVPVTAIKGMLGECLGASGSLQVVCLLESMRDGVLPGVPDFQPAEDGATLAGLSAQPRQIVARTGLVVAAWNGTCTALVVRAADRN